MYFAPFIVRAEHERKVPVVIERATAEDLKATAKAPKWQTDWTSEYLADEKIEKYSLKTKEGNLIALGAYRVMGRKAYVYILYLESAPASNPTLTAKREYYGIGEVMIAFGIKFSIDSGCRGDVLFEAKTPELARHYEKDFHARQVATLNSGGPQRYMLADENAWNLFEKISCRGGTVMEKMLDERYKIDELADAAGGYFAMPSADELAYTELLFDVCDQFGIHYYSADKKARAFVEEVTRVTWAKQQEERTGVQQSIRPAFTA